MYECQSISASDIFTTIARQLYLTRQYGRSLATVFSLSPYTQTQPPESLAWEIVAVKANNTQLSQKVWLRHPTAGHLEHKWWEGTA